MNPKNVLVVLSGGQDSTTCLYWAKEHYEKVIAITFNYGQRHDAELVAAASIASMVGVDHEIIDIPNVLKGTSPLVNKDKDVREYESAEVLPGGLEDTFVPARNMLFLTIASNRAYIHDCGVIMVGVSQEDFGGYPDCRDSFISAMQHTIQQGLDAEIQIQTPLIYLNKEQTVELALTLDGCMDALGHSHTCYKGEFPPCGKCHACLLRQKGFDGCDVRDPLLMRSLPSPEELNDVNVTELENIILPDNGGSMELPDHSEDEHLQPSQGILREMNSNEGVGVEPTPITKKDQEEEDHLSRLTDDPEDINEENDGDTPDTPEAA